MKKCLLAGGAGLLAVAATGPAAAQTTRSLIIEQVEVPYGDLDLATTAGAEAMLARLESAAANACGGKPRAVHADVLGPSKQRAYHLCRVAAVDAATLSLEVPLVRAIWLENEAVTRLAGEARRTTSDLLRWTHFDDPAAPSRN